MSVKDFNPFDKIKQPKQKELRTLKSLQCLAESKPKEITMPYKRYLLETQAFKKVGDKINLLDQPNNLTRPCKDLDIFLDELSMAFYYFFSAEFNKVEWPLTPWLKRCVN